MTFSTLSVKIGTMKPQHNGRQPHRPIPDAGGAAGDQFVVGRQLSVNHRGGKEGCNGQGIRLHGRHEIAEYAKDLLCIEAMFGQGAQQPTKAHNPRQRHRSENEDANEIFEDVPEQGAAHGVCGC
jgi:hypothetical protein